MNNYRDSIGFPAAESAPSRSLSEKWQELCVRYLPVAAGESIWRYSRPPAVGDLEQGWKLHVSATVLNAARTMEIISPLLTERNVQFKAPGCLFELSQINSGLGHGYSQIGKIITIYPRTDEEAVALAHRLHKLTYFLPAPAVPFDLRFKPGSNVYYRYGAFRPLEIHHPDGAKTPAIRDLDGNLIPDLREPGKAKPPWARDPFAGGAVDRAQARNQSPLQSTYRVFRALTQRGKGGVYQAVDLSQRRPRFCLLKEGRQDGEVGWDGRDGRWRVRHEERALEHLRSRGVAVPRVYSSFELDGNYYLALEFIKGKSLDSVMRVKQRRISISRALRLSVDLSTIMAQIHAAGWVWRDCKPSNLMVSARGRLRPLDFEGACPITRPDSAMWSTPAFAPPDERALSRTRSSTYDDLYALGAVLYLLLTGILPDGEDPQPVEKLRRDTPSQAREVISELLFSSPLQRPSAQRVAETLRRVLSGLELHATGKIKISRIRTKAVEQRLDG